MNDKGLHFFWLDATDHYLPPAVCARYGPADLCELHAMLGNPAYHGNVYCVETGRHGFNLCSDEDIRREFQYLSADEQHNALHCYLPSVIYKKPLLAKGEQATRRLVDRYLQWRTQAMPELVRCLDILHSSVFAVRKGKVAMDFGPNTSKLRLSYLLDIHLQTSRANSVKDNDGCNSFQEHRSFQKPKQNPVFHQLDALCDLMMDHGEMLRINFTFNFLFDNQRAGMTRADLYHEFRNLHKNNIPCRYWDGGAAEYLRSAFDTYALPWLPFNAIERFERIEK
jgi:hypothetical protein